MSRRRRAEPGDLPLFDLPIGTNEGVEEERGVEGPADEPIVERDESTSDSPAGAASEKDDRIDLPLPGSKADSELPLHPLSTGDVVEAPTKADGAPFQPALFPLEPRERRPRTLHGPKEPVDDAADELATESGEDDKAEVEASADHPISSDDQPALVDRLASGLADLAVQAIVLASMIGIVRLMDVPFGAEDWMPFAILALAFSFVYWVVPLAFWGQTPGMAWRGQIVRTPEDEALTFAQATLRWCGALLTLGLAGLPLLLAASGASLSDRLSQSRTHALPRND